MARSSIVSQKTSMRSGRDTGMVFQNFNLFPHMTTLEIASWRR